MSLEIPADLAPALMPVAWLLGTWEGVGVAAHPPSQVPAADRAPDAERHGGVSPHDHEEADTAAVGDPGEYQFGERVAFTHDGRDFLSYESTIWRLNPDGSFGEPDSREAGFWRVNTTGSVEVLVASATGVVEIYAGRAEGPRIEVATDVVGRTSTAQPYTAGRRLYGSVEGDLLYAYDAAFDRGQPDPAIPSGLQSLRSGRLRRVSA